MLLLFNLSFQYVRIKITSTACRGPCNARGPRRSAKQTPRCLGIGMNRYCHPDLEYVTEYLLRDCSVLREKECGICEEKKSINSHNKKK